MRRPRFVLSEPVTFSYRGLGIATAEDWILPKEMRLPWIQADQHAVEFDEEDQNAFVSAAEYAEKEEEYKQQDIDETLARIKEASPIHGDLGSQASFYTSPLLTHTSTRQNTTPAKRNIVDLVAEAANGPTPDVARYTFYSPPQSPPSTPSPCQGDSAPLELVDRKGLLVNENNDSIPELKLDIDTEGKTIHRSPTLPRPMDTTRGLSPQIAPKSPAPISRRPLSIKEMLGVYNSSPHPPKDFDTGHRASIPSLPTPPPEAFMISRDLQLEPTHIDLKACTAEEEQVLPVLEVAIASKATSPTPISKSSPPSSPTIPALGVSEKVIHLLEQSGGLAMLAKVAAQVDHCEPAASTFSAGQPAQSAAKVELPSITPPRRSSRLLSNYSIASVPQWPIGGKPTPNTMMLTNFASSPQLDQRFKAEHLAPKLRRLTPEVLNASSDAIDSASSGNETTPVRRNVPPRGLTTQVKREKLDAVLDQQSLSEKLGDRAVDNAVPGARKKKGALAPEFSVPPIETQGTRSWTKKAAQKFQENKDSIPMTSSTKQRSSLVPPKPLANKGSNRPVMRTQDKGDDVSTAKQNGEDTPTAPLRSSKRKSRNHEEGVDEDSDYTPRPADHKRHKKQATRTTAPTEAGVRVGLNLKYSAAEMDICRKIMRGKQNSKELREECRQALISAGYEPRSVDALKFKYRDVN